MKQRTDRCSVSHSALSANGHDLVHPTVPILRPCTTDDPATLIQQRLGHLGSRQRPFHEPALPRGAAVYIPSSPSLDSSLSIGVAGQGASDSDCAMPKHNVLENEGSGARCRYAKENRNARGNRVDDRLATYALLLFRGAADVEIEADLAQVQDVLSERRQRDVLDSR
jgi:hypothetical protein